MNEKFWYTNIYTTGRLSQHVRIQFAYIGVCLLVCTNMTYTKAAKLGFHKRVCANTMAANTKKSF